MEERTIVGAMAQALRYLGFQVATEVANLYRSADIAVLDNEGNAWIIECKVSGISRALEQLRIHKLSADKVFIATPFRKTKESTLQKIREAGVGLIYVMPDGSINKVLEGANEGNPWPPARETLIERIMETK